MENIKTALLKLDQGNDNHWTADGLPRLDTVRMFASDQSINRDQLDEFKGFNRTSGQDILGPVEVNETAQPAQSDETGEVPEPTVPVAIPETTDEQEPETPIEKLETKGLDAEGKVTGVIGLSGQTLEEIVTGTVGAPAPQQAQTEDPEVLRGDLESIEAELVELRQVKARLDSYTADTERRRDHIVMEIERLTPASEQGDAIQDYLAAQRKALDARAGKIQTIRESGIDLKELSRNLKSPIDSAMGRKSNRGTGRPGS